MQTPKYILIRWAFGWSIEPGIQGLGGIPIDSMVEGLRCASITGPDSVIDPGIAHHLKTSHRADTCFVVGIPEDLAKWEAEIDEYLAEQFQNPEARWFHGTDTGMSSMAIFQALAENEHLRNWSKSFTSGEVPLDAADMGRCTRLVQSMGWEARLDEVAEYWKAKRPEWVESAADVEKALKAAQEKLKT